MKLYPYRQTLRNTRSFSCWQQRPAGQQRRTSKKHDIPQRNSFFSSEHHHTDKGRVETVQKHWCELPLEVLPCNFAHVQLQGQNRPRAYRTVTVYVHVLSKRLRDRTELNSTARSARAGPGFGPQSSRKRTHSPGCEPTRPARPGAATGAACWRRASENGVLSSLPQGVRTALDRSRKEQRDAQKKAF